MVQFPQTRNCLGQSLVAFTHLKSFNRPTLPFFRCCYFRVFNLFIIFFQAGYSPRWPQILDPLALASQVLGLQTCRTTLSSYFQCFYRQKCPASYPATGDGGKWVVFHSCFITGLRLLWVPISVLPQWFSNLSSRSQPDRNLILCSSMMILLSPHPRSLPTMNPTLC